MKYFLNMSLVFQLYQELRSHLRGKFPDVDFYVDRWPDPQAAAAVVDPAGEQVCGDLTCTCNLCKEHIFPILRSF